MTGFQAVDRRVGPQQAVPVVLADVVVGVFLLTVIRQILRKIVNQIGGQRGQILDRRDMRGVGQAAGIDEIRTFQPLPLGFLIHQGGKSRLGTGDRLGQRHCGIVAGLHNDTLQQLVHGHLRVGLDKHARAFGLPGSLGNMHRLLQRQALVL